MTQQLLEFWSHHLLEDKTLSSKRGGRPQQQIRSWCDESEETENTDDVDIFLDLVDNPIRQFQMETIIQTYHGYRECSTYSGRQINWFVRDTKTHHVYGCIGVGSSVFMCPARDEYIGYEIKCINHLSSQETKDYYINTKIRSLRNIGNNWRFTLMKDAPKNIGTKTLSLFTKEAKKEWKNKYCDPLVLLETFVEPPLTGIIYKRAGWIHVGMTKGDSIRATHEQNGFSSGYGFDSEGHHKTTKKHVFLKPLHPLWKKVLLKK